MAQDFTLNINAFKGLIRPGGHEDFLSDSESPDMVNFRVTQGYQLKRRDGYRAVKRTSENLRGIWCGHLGGKRRYLSVEGSKLFTSDDGFDSLTYLGEVPGEGAVTFFLFHKELYLLTGSGIFCFDGEKLAPLEPYVPILTISTDPSGAGVLYEEVNLLTRRVRQLFSPDGKAQSFKTAVRNITDIVAVRNNGKELDQDQYYWDDIDRSVGLTFAPLKGIDTLEIEYLLWGEDVSDRILTCRFATAFGGASDTRAFLYGSSLHGEMRYHSALVDGKPSMAYFPETCVSLVGTGEPITSIVRHYDRQLIFTQRSAYYSYLEYREGSEGRQIASFPVLPLNEERGCIAQGQALLVENTPVTLSENGLVMWVSTNIRDERNAVIFSEAIRPALSDLSEKKPILFYRKTSSELYLCFEGNLYVYSVPLKLFYYYAVPDILGFCQGEDGLYFYCEKGIFAVGGDTDDGRAIKACWRSKFWDFGSRSADKKLFSVSLYLKAGDEAQLDLTLKSENESEKLTKRVQIFGKSDGEKVTLRCTKRRFRALELCMETDAASSVCIWGLDLKGRRTDGESI